MPECPPRPPAPAAPSRSLTRLLVARFSFSRSHRTLRGIAADGRLCLRLGGCSFTGATAPLRRRRGSKTKGESSPRGSKLRSHTAAGGGGSREEKEGETEVFKPAAKAPPVPLSGRAQCPISTRAPPRAPREALLAGQPSRRFTVAAERNYAQPAARAEWIRGGTKPAREGVAAQRQDSKLLPGPRSPAYSFLTWPLVSSAKAAVSPPAGKGNVPLSSNRARLGRT